MNIGAQLYTVRSFTQTEQDFAETIRKVAAIGYTGVQISAVGPIPVSVVKDVCVSYGIEIIVTHTNPARIRDETEAVIEDHRCMGACYVGIGSMPDEYRTGTEGIFRFVTDYLPVAGKLQAAGMCLMYHNHDFEFEKFGGERMIDQLASGFSSAPMGFILDTYWVQAAGGDPAAWLTQLSGRVDVIHIKDRCIVNREHRMCEVMEGNLNWPVIFKASHEAGVKWAMVEQDDCYDRDPFECLRVSFENIQARL